MLLFVRYLAKILGLVASGFKRYDEQNSFFTQAHTALYLQLVSSAKKGGNVPFSRKKYMRTCFVLILCDAKTRFFPFLQEMYLTFLEKNVDIKMHQSKKDRGTVRR